MGMGGGGHTEQFVLQLLELINLITYCAHQRSARAGVLRDCAPCRKHGINPLGAVTRYGSGRWLEREEFVHQRRQ